MDPLFTGLRGFSFKFAPWSLISSKASVWASVKGKSLQIENVEGILLFELLGWGQHVREIGKVGVISLLAQNSFSVDFQVEITTLEVWSTGQT